MRRLGVLLTFIGIVGMALCGCGVGETTNADQMAKRKTLDQVASQSPNADKVEH